MLHYTRTGGRARFAVAGSTVILAAVLLFAGCGGTTTSPFQADGVGPILTSAGIDGAGTADVGATPALAATAANGAELRDLFVMGSPLTAENVVGRSRIKRQGNTIKVDIGTELFDMPSSVTVWAIIFNTPGGCTAGEDGLGCGLGDLGNAAANASAIWADGKHVGRNGRDGLPDRFQFMLVEGAPRGEVLFGDGLTDAAGAEVHFVVRSHGPPNPDRTIRYEQITHVVGGCLTELPAGSVPANLGECADVAVSVPLPRI